MLELKEFRHIKFPSDPKIISEIEPLVKKVMKYYVIPNDRFADILIALTEAVNNAICHGNKRCRDKYVIIDFFKAKEFLKCSVIDEGAGFNPSKLADPTAPENLHDCGGRGVHIIRLLCDGIEYRNNGTCLELSFRV